MKSSADGKSKNKFTDHTGVSMKRLSLFIIGAAMYFSAVSPLFAQIEMHEKLLPFKDIVGRTFKGKISPPDAQKEQWDVMHFERALNGNAIRILHSVNEGEYGGETMMFWDDAKQSLVYFYFTTAGFYTEGTMKMVSDTKWVATEKVVGSEDGITEVKSTGEIMRDGQLKTSSEYLKKGKWIQGHAGTYEESAYTLVKFR